MSDRQQSEEQLDLEGDDDAGYRRHCRDDSEEPLEDDENEDRQAEGDGHGEDDAGVAAEGEEPAAGDGGGEIGKRGPQGPEDEEERKKWDELLMLPPHGSEVFIGGLPRDITEEDLRELCEPFGEINEVT
jgi:heterogeneous nuclear ribonucleoprotein R